MQINRNLIKILLIVLLFVGGLADLMAQSSLKEVVDIYDPGSQNNNFVYVSPNVPIKGVQEIKDSLNTQINRLAEPVFVAISYTQDTDDAAVMERYVDKVLEAVGDYKYLLVVVANIPGSVELNAYYKTNTEFSSSEDYKSVEEWLLKGKFENGLFCEFVPVASSGYSVSATEDQYVTCITPSGLPISIAPDGKSLELRFSKTFINLNCGIRESITFPDEVLTGFTLEDVKYEATISNGSFQGYLDYDRNAFHDQYSKNHKNFNLTVNRANEGIETFACTITKQQDSEEEPYVASGEVRTQLTLPCAGGDYKNEVEDFASILSGLIADKSKFVYGGYETSGLFEKDFSDRLKIYSEETNNQIFVIFKEIPFTLDDPEKFTSDVVAATKSFSNSSMTLVCVPYYWDNMSKDNQVAPTAEYGRVNGLLDNISIDNENLDYKATLENFYKKVPKPYHEYDYVISYRGEIYEYPEYYQSSTVGHAHIYNLKITVDDRAEIYKDILTQYYGLRRSIHNGNPTSYQLDAYARAAESLNAFESDHKQSTFSEIGHGLLESSLKAKASDYSKIGHQYVFWYRDQNFNDSSYGTASFTSSPDDVYFIKGINEQIYQDNIAGIQALSAILTIVNADALADFGGMVYAGFYDDWDTSGQFAMGVAAVGVTGTILWKLTKGSKILSKGVREIEIIDNIASEVKWFDELPAGLRAEMGSVDSELGKFFASKTDEVRKELVDAWRKMDNLGADEAIRRNPGALDALSKPKGSRPDPSEYLSPSQIDNHLSNFDEGVVKITSYDPTGAVGPPGGTFVLPKSQADNLIAQAGGDVNKLEDLLGLNRGDLGSSPFRVDVDNPSGLRMPSGNEPGANEFWIPGGKTSGGILEATVDQIQPGTFTKSSVF